jgi:hypothetical protein
MTMGRNLIYPKKLLPMEVLREGGYEAILCVFQKAMRINAVQEFLEISVAGNREKINLYKIPSFITPSSAHSY